MAISSDHVIREVSKKLKYYFDVKRLEDGFDLSGVACPRLDHPPTKARPTLLYDGLHDRPLKHYFSPQQVKSALTQFKQPQGKNGREKEIRRQLERYFRRYQFNENAAKPDTRPLSTSTPSLGATSTASGRQRKSRPARSAKSAQSRSQQPVLSDGYYNTQKGGTKKLKPEATGGFGVSLKKRKGAFKGGQPVLRSAPPTGTSRHETERLVNIASRLLVATETIDLKNPPTGKYQGQGHREKDKNRGAPSTFESGPSSRHAIYTYDINGRRMLLRRRSETPPRSPTPPGNYVTITGEQADDQVMPHWLRKKVAEGGAGDPDRPQSAYGSPAPRPPDEDSRPHSAAVIRPRPKRTSSESEPGRPGQAKQGWGSNSNMEVGAQTDGALLKNYDPSEVVLEEGERTLYEVHVTTGTRLGASTKANIKVALFGDRGRTKDMYLEQSSTYKIKFQKGQKDVFKLDTFYVGPIKKIAIGHDRSELGYGWYLERVEVRDTERRILYSIPCERWLSSQDSDKRTYRGFDVEYNTTYNPEPPRSPSLPSAPAPEPHDASPRTDRSHTSYSSDSSHTSVDTNYSSRSKRSDRSSSRGKRTPPRRRSYTSQSSEYTSSAVSSASSSRSSSPLSTPRKPIQEEPGEDDKKRTEKEETKTKPGPVSRPLQRRDTFFDQRTAGPDYTSVLDSLSTTTEDRRDSQDFDPIKPLYAEKDPTGKPLTLIEDEDTARLEGDAADKEADREEAERVGARLSMPPPSAPAPPTPAPPSEDTNNVDQGGFKAVLRAAKTKITKVPVSETESEDEERVSAAKPSPSAPPPPPAAPRSEDTNDIDQGGFKAVLRAAKTKITKVPVSETESEDEERVSAAKPSPSAPPPPPAAPRSEDKNDVDLGGFKAVLRAAKTKITKVPVSETESEDEERVSAAKPSPSAPPPPPAAPRSEDKNDVDLGGFKAVLRAAKTKITKVPVSETESEDEERVSAAKPSPSAPPPPPAAPRSEDKNDVNLGSFKAGLRAAKTKITKVPVSETESDEEEQARAPTSSPSAPPPPPAAPPSKDTNDVDLGGFKAVLRAAKTKITKVPVSETESEDEERVSAAKPSPSAPPPPPAAPPIEATKDVDLGSFKAGLRAAKTKIQKVPVSETESDEEAPKRSPAAPLPKEVRSDVYLDGFKAGIQAAKTKTQQAPVKESDSESDDEQGPTIHEASKSGDLQRVRNILSKTPSKKDSVDERGWASVHIAAAGGHTDIIKWLAVTNANLNVETPTSYTAMHLAAMHGHTNTMIVLFAMGAKLGSKTVEQQSPLHVAAASGHLETVKWLVANRAQFDNTDLLGRMPIDLAKDNSHHDVADFLRSCQQEQERPGSGLSLIRSNSKQRVKSAPTATTKRRTPPPTGSRHTPPTGSGLSSDKEDGSFARATDNDSTDSDPGWRKDNSNRPMTSMGMRGSSARSDTETESKTEIKHDEELMEKRQIYDDQIRRMSEKNVSFLDAIRDEVG